MRKSGEPAAGRGRNVVLIAVAVGALALVGLWPKARATPPDSSSASRTELLETVCTSPGGDTRKLLAMEELCTIDSTDSRNALKRLADSSDDRVAVRAIGALCRKDFSGARSKVTDIYESTSRSDLARMAALTAYCCLKQKDGMSWSDIKSYVKDKAGSNQSLRAQYAELKSKWWNSEVDSD